MTLVANTQPANHLQGTPLALSETGGRRLLQSKDPLPPLSVTSEAEPIAKSRKTAATAVKDAMKTRVKPTKATRHIAAVPRRKAPASKSAAAQTTGKPQAAKLTQAALRAENTRKFTVPEVWRTIVKKNERQGSKLYDVLVCHHAVLANDNTYRKARSCPECRLAVQRYADDVAASRAKKATRRRGM